jgi:hypothetical protein
MCAAAPVRHYIRLVRRAVVNDMVGIRANHDTSMAFRNRIIGNDQAVVTVAAQRIFILLAERVIALREELDSTRQPVRLLAIELRIALLNDFILRRQSCPERARLKRHRIDSATSFLGIPSYSFLPISIGKTAPETNLCSSQFF